MISKSCGSEEEPIQGATEPQMEDVPNLDKPEISDSELSSAEIGTNSDALLNAAIQEDLLISEAIEDLEIGNSTPIRSTSSSPANLPKKGHHVDQKRRFDGPASSRAESDAQLPCLLQPSAAPNLPESPPQSSPSCDSSPEVEKAPNVSLLDTLQKLINLRNTLLNSTTINTGNIVSPSSSTTLQKKKNTGKSSSRKSRALR